jgi:TonB family protein
MKQYFIYLNGNSVGPYSIEDLRMLRIQSATPVWCEGLAGWKSAGEIPELQVLFFPGITSFSRTNPYSSPYNAQQGNNQSKKGLAIIIGIALILVATGIGFYIYSQTKDDFNHESTVDRISPSDPDVDRIAPPPPPDPDPVVSDASPPTEQPPEEIVASPQIQAEFPGGSDALNEFIRKTIHYPVMAKEAGIEGTVYIQFTIDKQGRVVNPKILRGVSPELDKEAIRMVGKMPQWKPAELYGKKVAMTYTQPIKFALQ